VDIPQISIKSIKKDITLEKKSAWANKTPILETPSAIPVGREKFENKN
jgi:hypothetical protein